MSPLYMTHSNLTQKRKQVAQFQENREVDARNTEFVYPPNLRTVTKDRMANRYQNNLNFDIKMLLPSRKPSDPDTLNNQTQSCRHSNSQVTPAAAGRTPDKQNLEAADHLSPIRADLLKKLQPFATIDETVRNGR